MTGAKIVVAVDGPAGSGKSSVSRAAARRLGFDYQDSGAAYRAAAWVTAVVSRIARIPAVRERLVRLFRDVIAANTKPGIITEGRDITTVVAPDADVRILLTASEQVRIARRSAEITGVSAGAVGLQLSSRDAQDSKVVDFLTAAEGVTTLDSTRLDFDHTVQRMVDVIRAAQAVTPSH